MSLPGKVLYVASSSTLFGADQALLRLLSVIDRTRYEPLVVLPSDGPLVEALAAVSVPSRILPLGWWIPATFWSAGDYASQLGGLRERTEALAAFAAEEKVDLIHTNTLVVLEGALAAAHLSIPHIWHSRGPFFRNGFPPAYCDDWNFFYSIVDLLSERVLCVSRTVEEQALDFCRLAPTEIIYDGLDLESFLAQPVETREEFCARNGIDQSAQIVTFVGGVQRRKGLIDLVDACGRLAPAFPDVVFAVCGSVTEPAYLEKVEERLDKLGISRHFRFLGFRSDVLNVLTHSEIVAHPARSEGFGLAVLEAIAAGKPVVATRSGGPEEILEDGVSGILVNVGDPDGLAQALGRLLADPGLVRSMGSAAAVRARRFGIEETARLTMEGYRDVFESGREAAWTDPVRRRVAEFVCEEVLARGLLILQISEARDQEKMHRREGIAEDGGWLGRLRRHMRRS